MITLPIRGPATTAPIGVVTFLKALSSWKLSVVSSAPLTGDGNHLWPMGSRSCCVEVDEFGNDGSKLCLVCVAVVGKENLVDFLSSQLLDLVAPWCLTSSVACHSCIQGVVVVCK